jgi:hypothetical protein
VKNLTGSRFPTPAWLSYRSQIALRLLTHFRIRFSITLIRIKMQRDFQTDWKWCLRCQGLFFSGNPSQGVCPADGRSHDSSQSGKYLVHFGETKQGSADGRRATCGQQGDWRWCHKCQGAFFAGNASQGICPVDRRAHDASQSGHYGMIWDDGVNFVGQPDWRRCRKCEGFFFSGNLTQGSCPAGGTHDGTNSGKYQLRWREF